MTSRKENEDRLGVFWHTQGSGKSYSMVFFSQKALRKLEGDYTFVIVTDRQELDDQIYKTFAACGAVTEGQVQARSGEELKDLLRESHRNVFTLIQKFHTDSGETYPTLSNRSNIIVMTDEAHRSQYQTFAANMRNALPNAAFLGFTGTPLMVGEEKTKEVFGDYVSIYNFRQSVEDGATVPLYYENRMPELQLSNEALNEDLERVIDNAELDERQEEKLQREFGREYQLIVREERLEEVAKDIVDHFMGRGHKGKAMVVSIDKATAIKMYDKVQRYWRQSLDDLRAQAERSTEDQIEVLSEKISFMRHTDMAVVVSASQNETEDMAAKGLDVTPHRKRMVEEDLETKFKDSDDPFRIVFVCAMWMTGFDAPSVSTIYLDKPMRNHTLMQTIARANRVFGDKQSGLIVDYIGVFRDLEKALAIYGSGTTGDAVEGETPVKDKQELVDSLSQAVQDAKRFLKEHSVDTDRIIEAEGFDKQRLLEDARDSLVKREETKKSFLSHSRAVSKLYKAVLPDSAAAEFAPFVALVSHLVTRIRNLDPEVDISGVMEDIHRVLDESITARSFVIPDSQTEEQPIDLSRVDFEELAKRFEKGRKATEAERLKVAVNAKIKEMVGVNRTRTDYEQRLQRLIDEYNSGAISPELYFRALIQVARDLTAEEQRAISEGLSEEELAIFDLLTKPEMSLTEKEKADVKKVARDLLMTLEKEKLVLDWKKRQQSRASVQLAVEEELDNLPEAYSEEIFHSKVESVYQHIYEVY